MNKYLTEFIQFLKNVRNYSDNTLKAYQNDISDFLSFLKKSLKVKELPPEIVENIKPKKVILWVSDKKISNRTRARKISAVKSFFRFLKNNNIISQNPLTTMELPKFGKKLPKYLTQEQAQQMFEHTSKKNYKDLRDNLIIELLYSLGLRRSEVINLKFPDIRIVSNKEGYIKIKGKGNKIRILPLTEKLIELFNDYISFCEERNIPIYDNLLLTDKFKPLYPKYVYNLVKALNPSISPHSLRHSFATHLLQNGADVMDIKELLGHSSLQATQVYLHLNKERLKKIYKKSHPRNSK